MKIKTLLFFVIGILFSCSNNDDENKIAGVNDFSGNYRILYLNNSSACNNGTIYNNYTQTYSFDDLEISSNGRFKRKIYSLNSNNECTLSEILEGQITITGSQLPHGSASMTEWTLYGNVVYDNSESIDQIYIKPSVNGVHNDLNINNASVGSGEQYFYRRST